MLARMALFALVLITPALAQNAGGDDPLRLAIMAHQKGDLSTAIRLYREFLKTHDMAEIRSNLGVALARSGDYAAAIPEYRKALEKLGSNPSVRMNLAIALYRTNRLPEAADELEIVRKASPDALQPAILLGDCLLQMGENRRVISVLTPMEAKYPNDRAVAYMLGTALLGEKQYALAQTRLDKILRAGETAESEMLFGYMLYQMHDNKAAAVRLKRAVELNPKLAGAHALYALALKESGDMDGSAVQFAEELKVNPYDFISNIELCLVLKQDGKLEEALAAVNRALQVRPGDPGALYQLATVHALDGKTEQARAELEQLIAKYPEFTEAHVSLATVYYRLKRKEDGDRERATVRQLQEAEQKRQAAKQNQ